MFSSINTSGAGSANITRAALAATPTYYGDPNYFGHIGSAGAGGSGHTHTITPGSGGAYNIICNSILPPGVKIETEYDEPKKPFLKIVLGEQKDCEYKVHF